MRQKIIFSLQTITPLFLAGADQTKAELRPSAFRGGLRYWYRALLGGIVGTDAAGLAIVVEQEARLFGATDRGSALQIRIPGPPSLPSRLYQPTSGNPYAPNGSDYLLWSMLQFKPDRLLQSQEVQRQKGRYCFPSRATFSLIVSANDEQDESFKRGLAAFWLLIQLGGIGSRSRRCGGSLQVQAADSDVSTLTDLPFGIPATLDEQRRQLSEGIRVARKVCGYTEKTVQQPAFDVLSPTTCRIWLLSNGGNAWQSENAAMDVIGSRLKAYYRTLTSDVQRKVFGLPVQKLDSARLPSPLHLSIKKLQKEQYIGVAVLFKTDMTIGKPPMIANYQPIEDWIRKSFPNQSSCEVKI